MFEDKNKEVNEKEISMKKIGMTQKIGCNNWSFID